MFDLRLFALATLLFSLFFGSAAIASPQPTFRCDVSDHPSLVRNGIKIGDLIYRGKGFVAFTGYPKANEKLPAIIAASGEQYSDGKITFHAKADRGLLLITGGPTFSCNSLKSEVIGEAKSLVTIVRSGPNVKFKRIDRLALNEPVELIGESGQYFQEYQWYKIRYGEGQEGYAWGGTMCVETELAGILIGCARHIRNDNQNGRTSNVPISGKSVFGSIIRIAPSQNAALAYKIPVGTPLQITSETGNFFETWQWVEVNVSGKGTGFVWGGTICSIDKQLAGVHFGCQ